MKYDDDREQPDPYLDWAFFLQDRDPARVFEVEPWEAVLVEPLSSRILDEIKEDENLRISDTEREYYLRVREMSGREPPFFLYRKLGYARLDKLFRVLLRGLPTGAGAAASKVVQKRKSRTDKAPLLAVIDDGLGFLNERFQRSEPGGAQTRVEGVFIQSIKQNPPGSPMVFGRTLSQADVQALIQEPDERAVYKEINDSVFAHDTIRSTERSESHGSHIMDLAGGTDPNDPTDPMREVPLVLVQLPPQIVDDTSGMQMVPHILQGLHWILLQAMLLGKPRVVVNLSFGITAGPKDGTSLFATHVAFLINLADLFGIALDVVVPFGNDYQGRQIAAVKLPPEEKALLDVRLQSDDRAPSYVEIRPDTTAPLDHVALGLVAPDGTDIPAQTMAEGDVRDIVYRGEVVGRMYHVPASQGRAAYLLIAFAPTSPVRDDALPANGQGPLIEPGSWRIVLADARGDGADLRLEIQRGDTMPGYRQRGRQAYFDDPDGYGYDMGVPGPTGNPVQGKSYTRLGPDAYVTQDGTNSAFTVVTGALGRFHTVGGAFLRRIDPTVSAFNQDPAVAAQYTSLNTRAGRGVPTGGARSEHNRALAGLRATGVLSGSGARFAGSSAAAAVYSRSLIAQNQPLADATAPGRLPQKVHHGAEPRD